MWYDGIRCGVRRRMSSNYNAVLTNLQIVPNKLYLLPKSPTAGVPTPTLQQRFGRGARSSSVEAYAILFAEAKYFDDERERLELARQERALKRKRTDESTHRSTKTNVDVPILHLSTILPSLSQSPSHYRQSVQPSLRAQSQTLTDEKIITKI